LKYDSVHGTFKGDVSSKKSKSDLEVDDILLINGEETNAFLQQKILHSFPGKI